MSQQQLRDQLQELMRMVQGLPVGNAQRARLEALVADIESQLGTPDEASLAEQIETAVSAFEIEHPRIAAILNNIIATLGNIGV